VAYALSILMLLEWRLGFPLIPSLIPLSFGARVAATVALVAPVGILLGVFFPTVLDDLKASAPSFVPWAWGINGIFSVLAPVASIALSATWGINALFVSAIFAYLAAALALPGL
jgi:hypothetical protein